jgi:hypothetical protein
MRVPLDVHLLDPINEIPSPPLTGRLSDVETRLLGYFNQSLNRLATGLVGNLNSLFDAIDPAAQILPSFLQSLLEDVKSEINLQQKSPTLPDFNIDLDVAPLRIPEVAFPSIRDSLAVVAARRSALPAEFEQAKSALVSLAAARDSTKGAAHQRHASVNRRLAGLQSTEAELQGHLRHQQCESSAVSRKRLVLLQSASGVGDREPETDDGLREEFEQFGVDIRAIDHSRLHSTLVKVARELAELRDAQRQAAAAAKGVAGANRCTTEWVDPVFALQGRIAGRIRMPIYV